MEKLVPQIQKEERQNRSKIQCFNCEKWGHCEAECWHGKGKGKGKQKSDDQYAHVAQDDD